MGRKPKTKTKNSDEYERRLLRLLGYLAFVIEEADKLGLSKTAIEARRAGLQLCYETGSKSDLRAAFGEGIEGHG